MPTVTTNRQLPYPLTTDPPDVQGDLQALAEAVDEDTKNVPYANAAARDVAIPSPVAGQQCWQTDIGGFVHYDGSDWIADVEGYLATATTAAGDVVVSYGITFTSQPNVQVTPQKATGAQVSVCHQAAPGLTSFTARITSNNAVIASGAIGLHWRAKGPIA